MQIDPNFPVKEFEKKLDELRQSYRKAIDRLKNDILLTKKLRIASQRELNDRIGAHESENSNSRSKRDHPV